MGAEEHGIILFSHIQNEYDLRVVLLTEKHGKVTAFIKNARKVRNEFKGKALPLVFGKFDIYYGHSSNKINSINVIETFDFFYTNLDEAVYAYYFLEFANYYGKENNDEKELLKLIYVSLKEIIKKEKNLDLIKAIFEYKYLVISGVYPSIEVENSSKDIYLDIDNKKIGNNAFNDSNSLKISKSVFNTLEYLSICDVKKTYNFTLKKDIIYEIITVVKKYYDFNHYHKFNSLDYFQDIKTNKK